MCQQVKGGTVCSIGSPNSHECTIKALAIAREQRISISCTRSGIYTTDITHGCDCIFIIYLSQSNSKTKVLARQIHSMLRISEVSICKEVQSSLLHIYLSFAK